MRTDRRDDPWRYSKPGAAKNVGVEILKPSGDIQLSVDAGALPQNFTAKVVEYDFHTWCSTNEYPGVPTTMQGAVRFGAPAPAPANPVAVAGGGEVALTWDSVVGADSYVVYVNGARYPNVASGHTFFLPGGTPAGFKVAAVRAGVEGVRSPSVTATPTDPPVPANLHAVAGDGQVTLTWDPVRGADSYAVYVNGVRYPNTASGHTFSLPSGTPARFEVAEVRAGVEGVRSPSVTATPTDPPKLHALAGNGQVTLTWDPVTGADSYAVYVNGARYQNIVSGHTFFLPNRTPARFEVAAVRAGVEGMRSPSVPAPPSDPPIPANLAAVAAEWGVMLTWDPVAGVDHYEIYADGTAYQWVDADSTRAFVWAVADRTYRFEVTAVRGD